MSEVDEPRDAHSFRYQSAFVDCVRMQNTPVQGPGHLASRDPATEVNHDFITPLGYYDDADQMLLENATWPEWGTG